MGKTDKCEFIAKMKTMYSDEERNTMRKAYEGIKCSKKQIEGMMPQFFWGLRFANRNDFHLSVQASAMHYSIPRQTLALKRYERFELAFILNDQSLSARVVFGDCELAKELEGYEALGETTVVYPYVPKELVERVYQKCQEMFGACVNE